MGETTPDAAGPALVSDTGDSSGGLFTGFEGYVTPTVEDYQRVLRDGIVVPDANVLLNLYRYTVDARDDLLAVLDRLGDRLWVPYQALYEFWHNRESVLRDPRDTDKTLRELTTHRDRAANAFRTWANRVSLPAEQVGTLLKSLNDEFDTVMSGISEFADVSAVEAARDTHKDQVLLSLEPILRNRVGPPLDEKVYAEAVTEGLRRVDAREPPGYMDKKKDDDGAAGDYLVWLQVLLETERRRCDVVFVTGDVKEDWWREEHGERRGPRIELVDELRSRAGTQLFMLRPTQLLEYAGTALAVRVRHESVQDADRVDRLLSESEEAPPQGGWDTGSLTRLLRQLELEAPVQAATIGVAVRQNGFVSRDQVYAIGKYPEGRSLRGFTRPINRITQLYRDERFVPEDAVDILWTVYNKEPPDDGLAAGFRVHKQVLPLLREEAEASPSVEV